MKIVLCLYYPLRKFLCDDFTVSGAYKRKVRLYEDLLLFCGRVKSQVAYFQSRLFDILAETDSGGAEFRRLCGETKDAVASGRNPLIDASAVSEICGVSLSDGGTIAGFFEALGGSDGKNQQAVISGYENIFSARLTARARRIENQRRAERKTRRFRGAVCRHFVFVRRKWV